MLPISQRNDVGTVEHAHTVGNGFPTTLYRYIFEVSKFSARNCIAVGKRPPENESGCEIHLSRGVYISIVEAVGRTRMPTESLYQIRANLDIHWQYNFPS